MGIRNKTKENVSFLMNQMDVLEKVGSFYRGKCTLSVQIIGANIHFQAFHCM